MLTNKTNPFTTANNSTSTETLNSRNETTSLSLLMTAHALEQADKLGNSTDMIEFLSVYNDDVRNKILDCISLLLSYQRDQQKQDGGVYNPVIYEVEFLSHLLNAFSCVQAFDL